MKIFEFKVRFRNDTMGFTKAFDVEATQAVAAISAATVALEGAGYDSANFQVTEVIRGREVGT